MGNIEIPYFLDEMLKKQYGEELTNKIIKGYEAKRVLTFRVNTLKSNVSDIENTLIQNNINYERVSWNKEAFVIRDVNKNIIENMDIYKEGKIYLQSLSSMLPPIILQPKPQMDILDMAAAPGGKTTQIAAMTQNKANITACEINGVRIEKLKHNIEMQGAKCVYIMKTDARKIDDFFSFDQILLDTPCSGSGILSLNDNNISKTFTTKLINKTTSLQIDLLKKAIKILKVGSEMVYSTCSILSCENEDILNKVLGSKKIEIVPINTNLLGYIPLLPTKIKGTICVCPNELYEGFFVAKIKKLSN